MWGIQILIKQANKDLFPGSKGVFVSDSFWVFFFSSLSNTVVFIFVHIILFVSYLRCHKNVAVKTSSLSQARLASSFSREVCSEGPGTISWAQLVWLGWVSPSHHLVPLGRLPAPPLLLSRALWPEGALLVSSSATYADLRNVWQEGKKIKKVSFTWGRIISAIISHQWPGHDSAFTLLLTAVFDNIHIPH